MNCEAEISLFIKKKNSATIILMRVEWFFLRLVKTSSGGNCGPSLPCYHMHSRKKKNRLLKELKKKKKTGSGKRENSQVTLDLCTQVNQGLS